MFRPAPPSSPTAVRLAAFPFGGRMTASGLGSIARLARPVSIPRGTTVVEEGQACAAVVLVERGEIRVFKQVAEGREISLYHVHPSESCVLALSAVLGGAAYPATAVVVEDLHAPAFDPETFRRLFDTDGAIRGFVMELFASRFAGLMALVEEVAFKRMDERLARFLLAESELVPGALKPVARTHAEIARELGTSREVVTRLLQSFEADGLVGLARGQVRVTDADALRRWLP